MANLTASFEVGGKTVMSDVTVTLSHQDFGPISPRLGSWSGHFVIPDGNARHGVFDLYQSDESTLRLMDGRVARVTGVRLAGMTPGSVVTFTISGAPEMP